MKGNEQRKQFIKLFPIDPGGFEKPIKRNALLTFGSQTTKLRVKTADNDIKELKGQRNLFRFTTCVSSRTYHPLRGSIIIAYNQTLCVIRVERFENRKIDSFKKLGEKNCYKPVSIQG